MKTNNPGVLPLLFSQISLLIRVDTYNLATFSSPGRFADGMLSILPDHEWAIADRHCQKRQWEREEMSLLVLSAVTQELQTVGVHLQLCCSMWKSLQAPHFYGSCGKMQSRRCESPIGWLHLCCYSSKISSLLFPPLVLLATYSIKPPGTEELPRSQSNRAKFIRLERSWPNDSYDLSPVVNISLRPH